MAFFFIMFTPVFLSETNGLDRGTQNFINPIKGHEHLTVYCPRCHNIAVKPQKNLTMFTFCFIPIIPLGNHREMRCTICGWHQDLLPGELEQIEAAQRGGGGGWPTGPPPQGVPQQQYSGSPPPGK